jgi:hypothetical protein
MMKSLMTSAVAASVAVGVFRAYRDAMSNNVLISINEFVVLPNSDTQSFTDLSSTVEGEVRVETNTLAVYKYLLRLNAFFLEMNVSSPVGRDGRRRTAVEVPSNAVPLGEVVINDIVESTALGARQPQLTFTPACTSHQTLVQYKTRMHEEFMAPVSIRDAVVQSVGPGQLRLTFVVIVHAAVLDLEMAISLPKQTRALTVNTDGIGSWKPSASSDREILWYIGASGTGGSNYRNGETASLATLPTNVQEQQRKLFGSRSSARRARDAGTAAQQSPERLIGDETVILGNLEDYPHAELGSFMERIHFELVYSVNEEANEDGTNTTNGGNRRGKKAARQQQRREVNEYGGDVPAPGVGLSYAIAATASSLTVKKLQIVEEKPTWDPSAHWLWRTLSLAIPKWTQTPKLCRKAQYTTRISQTASVEVQY